MLCSTSHVTAAQSKMSTLSAGIQRVRLDVDSTYSGRKGDAFAQIAADQSGDTLPFYPIETQILSLWDQLNELKLEKALLEAQVGAREPMVIACCRCT